MSRSQRRQVARHPTALESPSCRSTGGFSRPATSSSSLTQYSLEFSRLRSELYPKYSWGTSTVQQALNDLVNTGYLTQTFAPQEYVMKGKDVFGNPIMLPPDPSIRDDMERAKTVVYSLTPRALDWFKMRVGPSKMGDPKHARVIEKLLKEEYWSLGYYCVVDWGETSVERPDIAVLKPAPKTVKDKLGNDQRISNPFAWDYTTATAVEVEMSPQKSKEQLLKNYRKNKGIYEQIRFVVTSGNQAQQLQEILGEDGTADPVKYRIDIVEFESLNVIEAPKPTGDDVEERSEEAPEALETGSELSKAEENILSHIVIHGFTSREEIVQKCKDAGFEIGARSVSRCLKILTEKGLLERKGNGYVPTERSRKRARQDTL